MVPWFFGGVETWRLMSYLDLPRKIPGHCQALHIYLLKNKFPFLRVSKMILHVIDK